MKKMLGLIALTATLASCGSTFVGNDATLTSQYYVTNANLNGQSYSGPAICDDRATNLAFSFSYLGATPSSVTAQLQGATGQYPPVAPDVTNFDDAGDQLTIYFTAQAGTVPLSKGGGLKAQAIIPTPIPSPNVIGATRVAFTVNSPNGGQTTQTTQYVAVVDNCQ